MLSLYKVKNMQAIINVDSRTRSHGTDSAFSIDLRESLNLGDHQVRVDNCQFSNSFLTTDLGANIYYKNGATIQYYTLPERPIPDRRLPQPCRRRLGGAPHTIQTITA